MKTNCNHKTGNRSGFSLVEILLVVAVIGIITGISATGYSKVNEAGGRAAAKRNAQSLCSLYGSARSVGAIFASDTKEGLLDEMVEGRSGEDLNGSQFKMSPLSASEKTAALAFCSYDRATDTLAYHEDGVLEEALPVDEGEWGPWTTFTDAPATQATALLNYYRSTYPQYQFQAIPDEDNATLMQLQYRERN